MEPHEPPLYAFRKAICFIAKKRNYEYWLLGRTSEAQYHRHHYPSEGQLGQLRARAIRGDQIILESKENMGSLISKFGKLPNVMLVSRFEERPGRHMICVFRNLEQPPPEPKRENHTYHVLFGLLYEMTGLKEFSDSVAAAEAYAGFAYRCLGCRTGFSNAYAFDDRFQCGPERRACEGKGKLSVE